MSRVEARPLRVPSGLWIVVPVKRFADTKRRLMPLLSVSERRALAGVMLDDVLNAIGRARGLAGVMVVTDEPRAAATARAAGAVVLGDAGNGGLNAAVATAARRLADDGASGMLVLPADVPLITAADIEAIARAHRASPSVTLVPAEGDGGTNAFACSPPLAVACRFGEDSLRLHRAAATAAGIAATVLRRERAGCDLDRPEDVARFLRRPSPTSSYSYLVASGIGPPVLRHRARSKPGARDHGDTTMNERNPKTMARSPALALAPKRRLSRDEAMALTSCTDMGALMRAAAARRDAAHGAVVTYSRKVFIPLTRLCRDVCHYCTFATRPQKGANAYLTRDEVLAIARSGAAADCREALFTLGDKPELRYRVAREELKRLGHETTLSYLAEMAARVLNETGLLPHLNPGLLGADELAALRKVSVSQGIMLESAAERLCARGGPHFGSPDKAPAARLMTLRLAGEAAIPFTSGILIGIGETRAERIDALLALRDLNDRHGQLQEIIVQNFRPKPGTPMAATPAPSAIEHLWTISVARLLFEPAMNIQAPPNLSPGSLRSLVDAGINDWGGVSPVTPDHVNPEAPWPHLRVLERATQAAGGELVERLALYPSYVRAAERWVDPDLRPRLLRLTDTDGYPRTDGWSPGMQQHPPASDVAAIAAPPRRAPGSELRVILAKAARGDTLGEHEIVRLFRARGHEYSAVCRAADTLRAQANGDTVTYVVNRNINYTNICGYRCQFCAFAKGKTSENLRGEPYDLPLAEIQRRVREAVERGATEICMQGGIHPAYTGNTYLEICRAVKAVAPAIHVHAFSPLEVFQGAHTLGIPIPEFLAALKEAGLGTLPGTAAEILDDEVRAVLCPDKIRTAEWLEVMRTAHGLGLRSTATIMFGHLDRFEHWARHLLRVRALQADTGGFTEFVPLPFVHMEAPIFRKGRARPGPTFREAVLMHAVARLALHPLVPNIQASWVKLGPVGVRACLDAGVNDLGGTLMDESISRAAGASHGAMLPPAAMEELIGSAGRRARVRTTLYAARPCGTADRPAVLADMA